jgi:O-antigen/teichoic acid export membrane protein
MVTVVTGFGAIFMDLGLSAATIQAPDISHEQVTALFWINVAFGLALTATFSLSAPLLATIYGIPQLLPIAITLAFTFTIDSISAQHRALLRRAMQFKTLAIIEVTACLTGVLTGVGLAFYGAGHWALVSIPLSTACTQCIATWLRTGWIPGLPSFNVAGTLEMLRFGGYLSGFSVVNYFARNADQLLIGRYCGALSLGNYSRAYNLMMLPISQINGPLTGVMVPALSLLRNDKIAFARLYLRTVNAVSWLTVPLMALLAALSNDLFPILYGDQWKEAGIIFKLLAPAAIIQPFYNSIGWVFVGTGKTDRMFSWSLIASPIIVLSIAAGLPFGARGVAIGYGVALLFGVLPWTISYITKDTAITKQSIIGAVAAPFLVAVTVFSLVEMLGWVLQPQSMLVRFSSGLALGVGTTVTALLLVPRCRMEFGTIYRSLRNAY